MHSGLRQYKIFVILPPPSYCVVSYVTGGSTQVDDGSCSGAAVGEGVDVGHDIVPKFALLLSCHGEVDVLHMSLHLRNLGISDGEP